MNKDWSNQNKEFQARISKEATFKEGIIILLNLRTTLFEQISQIIKEYPETAFYQMPYPNAKGYHCKTLAYSIWHIFRIEDICVHELICKDSIHQIFETGDWQKKINATIITTGNELNSSQIVEFSKNLDIKALYEYAKAVMEATNQILINLTFADCKKTFSEADRQRLINSKCVSSDENAVWLIDYWCNKDIKGLLKMPFSRHWIMHIEAMQRIKNRLIQFSVNSRTGGQTS